MKFGIAFANVVGFDSLEGLQTLARSAESAGFESLWTVEHVIFPDDYESTYPYDPSGRMPMTADLPMPDPLVWLAFVASATRSNPRTVAAPLTPRSQMMLSPMNNRPIFLWSVVVSQSTRS